MFYDLLKLPLLRNVWLALEFRRSKQWPPTNLRLTFLSCINIITFLRYPAFLHNAEYRVCSILQGPVSFLCHPRPRLCSGLDHYQVDKCWRNNWNYTIHGQWIVIYSAVSVAHLLNNRDQKFSSCARLWVEAFLCKSLTLLLRITICWHFYFLRRTTFLCTKHEFQADFNSRRKLCKNITMFGQLTNNFNWQFLPAWKY